MRRALFLACAVLLPAAAAAQDSLLIQYLAASKIFRGGWQDMQDFVTKEPPRLLNEIDGKWTNLSILGPANPQIIASACERVFAQTRKVSDFTFQLTIVSATKKKTMSVDVSYTALGGNSFSYSTDFDQYLARMFPDGAGDKVDMGFKLSLARNLTGFANVYRPSPDILVIAPSAYPAATDIYGRCP